jgi:carbon starvation protein
MVKNVYLNPEAAGYNVVNGVLSIIMLALGLIIVVTAIRKWTSILQTPRTELAEAA